MAVTITSTELDAELHLDDDTKAQRLLSVATELVNGYAPGAPDAVSNEAVIRTAGWLWESPAGNPMSHTVGDVATTFATGNLSALRHSGAMSLLSRWKVRRAGRIG